MRDAFRGLRVPPRVRYDGGRVPPVGNGNMAAAVPGTAAGGRVLRRLGLIMEVV